MLSILKNVVRWLLGWIYYICIICFIGGMVGVVTHVLWGMAFYEDFDLGYMASLGLIHGLQYAGVWAGGLSIVICVMRARKEWLARQAANSEVEGEGVV